MRRGRCRGGSHAPTPLARQPSGHGASGKIAPMPTSNGLHGTPGSARRDGTVDVLLLRLDEALPAPAYAHPGDAGADLVTAVDALIAPGERVVLPTGVAIALPDGYAAFVHPRSGLAARCGMALVNAPGTIDAGYRGEVQVIVVNLDPTTPITLTRGDRIAQLVVQRVERAVFHEVRALPGSDRSGGGLGSTGGVASAGVPTLGRPAQTSPTHGVNDVSDVAEGT